MDFIWSQIQTALEHNQFLQGGMVLGLLTWVGYQLKAVPAFVWNKFRYYATYTIHFDQTSEFYRVFSQWLDENHPQKFRNVEVRFNRDTAADSNGQIPAAAPDPNHSLSELEHIKVEKRQFTDSNVIFYKGRWLWVSKDRKEVNTTKDLWSLYFNSYSISGLFAKDAIELLCQEMADRRNAERQDDAVMIGVNSDWYFNWAPQRAIKSLEHIFFSDKPKLLKDLERFQTQREFYKAKNIKFKRAYLLYGRGGTGKTSIALGIAKHLGYDVYSVNLASVRDNVALQNLSRNINPRSVVLIEDIDTILEEREMRSESLNFGTVLNFLDGIYAPSDCILVMTTNKPEVLDSALVRKGRVDLALHIDYPGIAEVEEYISDFYDTWVELPFYTEQQVRVPMSEIQDACLRNEDINQAVREISIMFEATNGKAEAARA